MEALKRSLGITSMVNGGGAPAASNNHRDVDLNSASSRPAKKDNNIPDSNDEDGEKDDRNTVKMKSKLMSMWNNVKYGKTLFSLDPIATNFSSHSPVWLLGVFYHRKMSHYIDPEYNTPSAQQVRTMRENDAALEAFMEDFSSRVWLTYRREFEEFHGTSINTDCGWGCMIRSGQMMVANALLVQNLGRNWRWRHQSMKPVLTGHEVYDESVHRSIIRLFGDSPCESTSPFSIHQLVSISENILGRKPGDWFGPAATAHLLKAALEKCRQNAKKSDFLSNFRIYVSQDTTVYKQDILDMCCRITSTSKETSPEKFDAESNFEQALEDDGFSILRRDAEEVFIVETGRNETTSLESGSIAGVPYFSENFVKVEREQLQGSSDVDPSNYFSLQGELCVDGEEWTVETPSVEFPSKSQQTKSVESEVQKKRLYPSLSEDLGLQRQNSIGEDLSWRPVLILIPVRLGSESRLNPVYGQCVQALLADPTCVGIIGGRPKHSLYFVGFQDDNLIHLDPHLVQDRVDVFRDSFSLKSFHCSTPRKMALSKMDPSCCLGFLVTSRWQFDAWCEMTRDLVLPQQSNSVSQVYPMFTIEEGRAKDVELESKVLERIRKFESYVSESNDNNSEADNYGTEDFVFL